MSEIAKQKGRPKGGVWRVVTVQRVYHDNVLVADYAYHGNRVQCTEYFPGGMVRHSDTVSLDAFVDGMQAIRKEG